MPRSNGRPADRRRKTPKPPAPRCMCGGKPTKYGCCVRCLDSTVATMQLQTMGVYLPSRTERNTRKPRA